MIKKCIAMFVILVVVWGAWGFYVNGLEPQIGSDIALAQMNDTSTAHVTARTYGGFSNVIKNPTIPVSIVAIASIVIFRKELDSACSPNKKK